MDTILARLEKNLVNAETHYDIIVAGFRIQEYLDKYYRSMPTIKA